MKKPKKKPRKKRTRRQAKKSSGSWIESLTGKDAAWWVSEVQRLITKHSYKTKDPWHKATREEKVVMDLVRLVRKHGMPKTGPSYDGNMRIACILSYVLALWVLRLSRAKSYDPRRPVRLRQGAYWNRLGYAQALFMAITDESLDPTLFPGQNWESPWDPRTTDGFFL